MGLVVALACWLPLHKVHADPDALWHIVHERCVPDMRDHGAPSPCVTVSLSDQFAVLKDLVGTAQMLLIPTIRVTGIEDPTVLAPDAPDWMAHAWSARRLVEARLGRFLPDSDLSLVVNATTGRSQNQFHIHIDCLRPDVASFLAREALEIGGDWAPLPAELPEGSSEGRRWMARWTAGASLEGVRPLTLLADGLQARGEMGRWTLVVVGERRNEQPGFLLLADRADLLRGDLGNGEALQDHRCAVAGE